MTGFEIEPSEAPDFLLQSPGRTIGLELTAMVRGGSSGELSPKVRFEFREKVKAMARRVYMERGLPPVWVNLRWSPSGARGRIEAVSEKLADLVAETIPVVDLKDGWGKCELAWEELPEALQGHLTGLTIMQNPRGTATTWTAGWAGYPDLDREELVAEIRRKEQIAAGYVTRYDELWLMVYATGMGEAEYLLLPPEANTMIATTFHRVYFMDGEQKVTVVAIDRTQPFGN